MERKFYGRYGIYAPLILLITLTATTLRTVAVLLGVNAYGFFEADAIADTSAYITVAGVLLALTYPLTQRKARPIFRDGRAPLTYVPAAVLGICALLFGTSFAPHCAMLLEGSVSGITVSAALLLVLSVGAILYAATVCLIESTLSDTRATFGMMTVMLWGVYTVYLHYDQTLPLNSPVKITDQMTYLALALFFLYEVRISIGREKQGCYGAFGMIAALLTSYSAIPNLILYIYNGRILSLSLSATILTVGTLVFIVSRLIANDSSPEDRPAPLMGEIIRISEARDAARAALAEVSATPTEVPSTTETDEEEEDEPTDPAPTEEECEEDASPEQITLSFLDSAENGSMMADPDLDPAIRDTQET